MVSLKRGSWAKDSKENCSSELEKGTSIRTEVKNRLRKVEKVQLKVKKE